MERIQKDALDSSPETLTEFRRLMMEAFAGSSQHAEEASDLNGKLDQLSRLVSSKIEPKTKRTKMVDIREDVRTQLIAHESNARTEIV